MEDQIIDAAMAQKLQTNAFRDQPLVGWVIKQDLPDYPDEFVARLFNGSLAPYILVSSTLPKLQARLPLGLVRIGRQPADPPDIVEVWFAE